MKTISCLMLLTLCTPLMADEGNPKIDYKGFLALSAELEPERALHRISEEKFLELAAQEGTVVLDSRSKAKFDMLHVKGAKHLNFSDFTEESLTQLIPDKNTAILIYCNNNFEGVGKAMITKGAPLALNIPTYINLRGYGYKNVYELGPNLDIRKSKIPFVGTDVEK